MLDDPKLDKKCNNNLKMNYTFCHKMQNKNYIKIISIPQNKFLLKDLYFKTQEENSQCLKIKSLVILIQNIIRH